LTWAGLRGALSLALALSIPLTVRDRAEVEDVQDPSGKRPNGHDQANDDEEDRDP
jgi:hypothetical protein